MTCIPDLQDVYIVAADEASVKAPEVIATATFPEESAFNRMWRPGHILFECELIVFC